MSLPSASSSPRHVRLVVLAGASVMALLMSACSSTKDNQFATSAPAYQQGGNVPFAATAPGYPPQYPQQQGYPQQGYAQPYPQQQQGYAQPYPNQAPNQAFATSSWAPPGAYGQNGVPYGYAAPQPLAPEKESYRDELIRKRNQQK
ncbi:MAG: hypothetical protein V4691_00630 [Pseudomonadota bacterium]